MFERLIRHWRTRGTRGTRFASVLIALAAALGMTGLWLAAPPILARADLAIYDQHFRVRGPRAGHEAVAVVAVDERSLASIGRWPWPRSVLAELVRRLDAAGAAAIAIDVILSEPEVSGEARAARTLRTELAGHADARGLARIDAMIRATDHDAALADALRASDRVVLALLFRLAPVPPAAAPERQGPPLKSALGAFRGYEHRGLFPPINADAATPPIPRLGDAAHGLGHVNMQADFDGVTRYEALIVEHRGHYYPSLALEAVRVAAGVDPFALQLEFGHGLRLGELAIPMDARARVLIDYAGPDGAIPRHSAADVLAGRVTADRVKDRIVFVGATAEGTYDLRVTPFSGVMPGVEKHANMAANMLDGRFIVRPVWVELVEGLALVALPLLLGVLLPRLRPLTSLGATVLLQAALFAGAHAAFRQGLWLPVVYPSVAVGLTFVGVTVYRFLTEERQRRWTKRAFQQYVSPEVVERIVDDPGALAFGGEVRTMSILFSDIRGFTTFSESHDPREVVSRLREHLTALTDCVLEERGTLDKYIGDCVMAIFGAPIAMPDHAVRACRCGLRMVEACARLNAKNEAEGKPPLRIGVGINSGDVVVGNLGSEQVFSYTVTGDAVNLASRVEGLNKDFPTERSVIITQQTYDLARDAIEVRPLAEVKVKGKAQAVVLYELVGMKA